VSYWLDPEERAARWTVRFLAAAVFVAVLGAVVAVTLRSLRTDGTVSASGPSPAQGSGPKVLDDVGPLAGVDLPSYAGNRAGALAAAKGDVLAVASLQKYVTEAQARALVSRVGVVALLVAAPGTAPDTVKTDLATWAKAKQDATKDEREEIRKLIPTVDDPAFKSFYQSELDRLDKAAKAFTADGAFVFAVVVRGAATSLQELAKVPDVRLVDVAPPGEPGPDTVYRGIRPEEKAKANDPPIRPS
jgi:hypothetical protein